MKNLLFILFFLPFFLFAQEKGAFRFGLEANYRAFNPTELNKIINDKDFAGSEEFDNVAFKKGIGYGIHLSYNFIAPLSLGIYGEYQYSSTSQKLYYNIEYLPGYYLQEITLKNLNVRSYSFGLNTNIILNNLPFWKNNSWLSRI